MTGAVISPTLSCSFEAPLGVRWVSAAQPHVCSPLECVFGGHKELAHFWVQMKVTVIYPRGWMYRLERGESPWVFVLCVHRAALTAQHPCRAGISSPLLHLAGRSSRKVAFFHCGKPVLGCWASAPHETFCVNESRCQTKPHNMLRAVGSGRCSPSKSWEGTCPNPIQSRVPMQQNQAAHPLSRGDPPGSIPKWARNGWHFTRSVSN